MISKILKYTFFICLISQIGSYFLLQRLPPSDKISPYLLIEPVQYESRATPFRIPYKGFSTTVTPRAEYQLYGLVVSHNDPFKWYSFDLTHDEFSIDTRDLCVIWGRNITSADYHKVSVHNDDYFCVTRWKTGTKGFSNEQLSNNHLITANDDIRRRIDNVLVGDQVYIRGKLVNYSEDRWNGRTRNSSLSRMDEGDGACEVLYVEDLVVISSYNKHWDTLRKYSYYGLIISLVMGLIWFFISPPQIPTALGSTTLSGLNSSRLGVFRPAGFWRRVFATLIDTLLWMLTVTLYGAFSPNTSLSSEQIAAIKTNTDNLALVFQNTQFLLLFFVLPIFYYVLMPTTSWQGTVGKRAMGIKIMTYQGERIGLFRSLWRYLLQTFGLFIPFIIIGILILFQPLIDNLGEGYGIIAIPLIILASSIWFLTAAFTREKRALHDYLAGTIVIKG